MGLEAGIVPLGGYKMAWTWGLELAESSEVISWLSWGCRRIRRQGNLEVASGLGMTQKDKQLVSRPHHDSDGLVDLGA